MVAVRGDRRAVLLVLEGVARQPELGGVFVLKGAYATEAVTGTTRGTADLDLTAVESPWGLDKDAEQALKKLLAEAALDACEVDGADWTFVSSSVRKAPKWPRSHPHGWDSFGAKVTLLFRRSQQHEVELDLSFGDLCGDAVRLEVRSGVLSKSPNGPIAAYGAEEIVAEKLRAFLQRLPPYKEKFGRPYGVPRVRDIRDVVAVVRAVPDLRWAHVSSLFAQKCRVRSVDCCSVDDFLPDGVQIEQLAALYRDDPELADQPFEHAWPAFLDTAARVGSFGWPGVQPLPPPRP